MVGHLPYAVCDVKGGRIGGDKHPMNMWYRTTGIIAWHRENAVLTNMHTHTTSFFPHAPQDRKPLVRFIICATRDSSRL